MFEQIKAIATGPDQQFCWEELTMTKLITLRAWAAARFDPPPAEKTLQRWARECWLFPIPQKYGRTYYVAPDARYTGPGSS